MNNSPKRNFDTGAVRDSENGKENYIEGVSWLALKRYAKYMDEKSSKYGPGNWKKGIPPQEYIKSAMRHLQKLLTEWEYGICEERDDHPSAITFNILGLMHELELYKYGKGRGQISEEYNKIYNITLPQVKEGAIDFDKTVNQIMGKI